MKKTFSDAEFKSSVKVLDPDTEGITIEEEKNIHPL